MTGEEFSSPADIADLICGLDRPLLLVFDCDGVLAPIVDHADDAELLPRTGALLAAIAGATDIKVAVLSGRSLDGLEQFGFDTSIAVAGSYGAERRGVDADELSDEEADLLCRIGERAAFAAERAGDGAWVERKPGSVVLHVRQADPERGAAAVRWLLDRIEAADVHEGSGVIELMARPMDKGTGLTTLRNEAQPRTTVYLGDDVPDEDAFAQLGPGDVGVKIGSSPTIASHRLPGPEAVRAMLEAIAERTGATTPDT